MKKCAFLAIIMAVFCFSFVSCGKSQYKNSEKALNSIWNSLQGAGENIPLADNVMYVSTCVNSSYSSRGFEVVSIQLTNGDSTTYQFCVEKTPYHGWMAEKNLEALSKDGKENLRPLNKEEKKYIKIAYNNIIHKQ